MLDFRQFQTYVKEHIKDMMPDKYKNAEVSFIKTPKNNGNIRRGISIWLENANAAPHIYLEDYYKSYVNGQRLDEIMKDIADVAEGALSISKDDIENIVKNLNNLEYVQDYVVMSVVNAQKNEKMLKEIPHIMKEDLAVIYKVLTGGDSIGMRTATISSRLMREWGIDVQQLNELAMKNSKRLMPANVQPLVQILKDFMSEIGMPADGLQEEAGMHVITNDAASGGAAAIFYDESVLSGLSEKFGDSLYILPSSIDEVIAIPADRADPKELAQMVQKINRNEVEEEKQLSDHVYHYDKDTHKLSLADTSLQELQMEEARPRHRR